MLGERVDKDVIVDRYTVQRELGSGAFGTVYEARDGHTGQLVAIKRLRRLSPAALVRFKQEFRAVQGLHHPHIVRLDALIERGADWLIAMELVEGEDLVTYVKHNVDDPTVDESRLRAAFRQLAEGLAALHEHGILHRDLKPANMRIGPDGRAVLLDFGLVTGVESDAQSTHQGTTGTAEYMAPEQATGEILTPAADWYAFGACLYEALTGSVPFQGDSPLVVLFAKQSKQPDRPSARVGRDVPADLEDLCMGLLARNPKERLGIDDVRRVLPPSDSDPVTETLTVGELGAGEVFHGREAELAQITSAHAAARAQGLRIVLVEAESGMGKSSLVAEWIKQLREREPSALILKSQCYENEQSAFKAFDAGMTTLARRLNTLTGRHGSLTLPAHSALLPSVFSALSAANALRTAPLSGVPADPPTALRCALIAFAMLLEALAEKGPVVIAVDDLQWADPESFRLLHTIGEPAHAPRVLILATVRPASELDTEVARDLTLLRQVVPTVRLALAGLAPASCGQLAASLLAGKGLPGWLERITIESRGHPLFVSVLSRYAVNKQPGENELLSLDMALGETLRRLDAGARSLLEAVALAGVPCSLALLARTLGESVEPLQKRAAELVRVKLLRRLPQQRLGCFHDRIRAIVLESLGSRRRRALYECLARGLGEQPSHDPALVATFYEAAGEQTKASPFAAQAAARATLALAFEQAADLYRRALNGVGERAPERLTLLTELGTVLQHAGRREHSAAAFEAAAELADPHTRLALKRLAGDQLLCGGYIAQGWDVLREVMDTLHLAMPGSVLWSGLRAVYHLAVLASWPLRWKLATEAQKQGCDAIRADVTHSVSAGLAMVDTVHGIYFAMLGARLSLALGDPMRLARSLCAASFVTSAFNLPRLSHRFNTAAARAAEQDGTAASRFYAEGGLFLKAFLISHDWPLALTLHRRIEAHWNEAGLGRCYEMDVIDQFGSWALSNQGHYAALRTWVDKLVAGANRAGDPFLSTSLRTYHSILFLAEDDSDGAQTDLEDALHTWRPEQDDFQLPEAWALFGRAEIMLYRGAADGRETLNPLYRSLARSLLDQISWLRVRRDHTQVRLCLAHAAMGDGATRTRALRHARRWLTRLRRQGSPSALAWASLCDAAVAHLAGDGPAAQAKLRTAIGLTSALDLGAFSEAARYRLAQSGGVADPDTEMREVYMRLQARGIKDPLRMLRLLAPGWPDVAPPSPGTST